MITREQVLERYDTAVSNLQFHKYAEQLLDSGAIELSDYDDNYRLPMILLSAVLRAYADSAFALYNAKIINSLVPFINR